MMGSVFKDVELSPEGIKELSKRVPLYDVDGLITPTDVRECIKVALGKGTKFIVLDEAVVAYGMIVSDVVINVDHIKMAFRIGERHE